MWADDDDALEAEEDKTNYQAMISDPDLTSEGQALLMSTDEEAQEALVQMEHHRRTVKEARNKQHQVKISRRYYKTSFKPAENKINPKSNVTCLRCGGEHRTANCPKPAGQTAVSAETQSAPFICFAGKENSENLVERASQDSVAVAWAGEDMRHWGGLWHEWDPPDLHSNAVLQGKAVVDGGATKTLGSVMALEQV